MVVARIHGVTMGMAFIGADGLALVVIVGRDREGQQPDQQDSDDQRHAGSVGAAPG